MEKEMLFEIETLQDWHLEANQEVEQPVDAGGGCNSNCSNNSADQP